MTLIFRVELLACEGRRLFFYVRVIISIFCTFVIAKTKGADFISARADLKIGISRFENWHKPMVFCLTLFTNFFNSKKWLN